MLGVLHTLLVTFTTLWLGVGLLLLLLSHFSRVRLLATPWTAAYQAPPSMRFSRQEYWSGLPLPAPICKLLDVKTSTYDSGGGHNQPTI